MRHGTFPRGACRSLCTRSVKHMQPCHLPTTTGFMVTHTMTHNDSHTVTHTYTLTAVKKKCLSKHTHKHTHNFTFTRKNACFHKSRNSKSNKLLLTRGTVSTLNLCPSTMHMDRIRPVRVTPGWGQLYLYLLEHTHQHSLQQAGVHG